MVGPPDRRAELSAAADLVYLLFAAARRYYVLLAERVGLAHFFSWDMIEFDREAIGKIIERVALREGLELVHWEAVGPRNNFVLRIYIDKPGGVSHGDCEAVSNQVGTLLDVEDLIADRYVLEVSSPGIERGLYKRADYERFTGSRIKVKSSQPIDGQRNFRGKLIGMVGDNVSLDADGRGQIEIPYEQIVRANIEYEF